METLLVEVTASAPRALELLRSVPGCLVEPDPVPVGRGAVVVRFRANTAALVSVLQIPEVRGLLEDDQEAPF